MRERLSIVAGTFIIYAALFFLFDSVFGVLGLTDAVHWICLPSGLRLVFVLVFAEWGAVGVSLATMFVALFFYFGNDLVSVYATGIISGLAPYLARYTCHNRLGMDLNLENLTARKLLAVSIVFALMSATMYQMFYTWRGHSQNFITGTAVMAFGDLMGTIAMIYILKVLLHLAPVKTP